MPIASAGPVARCLEAHPGVGIVPIPTTLSAAEFTPSQRQRCLPWRQGGLRHPLLTPVLSCSIRPWFLDPAATWFSPA